MFLPLNSSFGAAQINGTSCQFHEGDCRGLPHYDIRLSASDSYFLWKCVHMVEDVNRNVHIGREVLPQKVFLRGLCHACQQLYHLFSRANGQTLNNFSTCSRSRDCHCPQRLQRAVGSFPHAQCRLAFCGRVSASD